MHGFWSAEPETNVLKSRPKSLLATTRGHLHGIWHAEMKSVASIAFDFPAETDSVKYNKSDVKLATDRETPLTFWHFPAEYLRQIRHAMKVTEGNGTEKVMPGGRFCWRISPRYC